MTAVPLSRPIRVRDIPSSGLSVEVVATEAERAALAQAFGLVAIDRLEAHLTARRRGEGFVLEGRLDADVVYTCVLTLRPLPGRMSERIEARFVEEGAARAVPVAHEIEIDLSEEDPPEIFRGETADVGPIIAEFLALGLDSYPRTPGAVFEEPAPEEGPPKPFAALSRLRG